MINFEDTNKYQSKSSIINALDEKGNQVFNENEKALFVNYLIKTVDEAREVAILIVKCREAMAKKKEDINMMNYLKKEEAKNSLAYQVVNDDDQKVERAISWLQLLVKTDDYPKNKEEREKKTKELKAEIGKKEREQGKQKGILIGLKKKKKNLTSEKGVKEKIKSKSKDLKILLDAENVTDLVNTKITDKNGAELLLTQTYELPDFGYGDPGSSVSADKERARADGLSTEKTVNMILNKDENVTKKATKSIKEWVEYANGFLKNIENNAWEPDKKTYREVGLRYNDGRRWNNKHSIQCVEEEFGYSYLCVLRRVGDEKLIEVINKKNPSNKADLIKFVKRYFGKGDESSISPWEEKFGRTWKNPSKGVEAARRQLNRETSWFKTILKLNPEEGHYPYVDNPDFKQLFNFMYEIFPVDSSGNLESQTYLDDKSSSEFIEAKVGEWLDDWDDEVLELYVSGHKTKPPLPTAPESDRKKHLQEFLKDKITKILPGTSFKDLTQIWWDEFRPFLDGSTRYWDDRAASATSFPGYSNKTVLKEVTDEDSWRAILFDQIRYARTMRNLAHKIGISNEIDEFDNYFLEVADKASEIATRKEKEVSIQSDPDEILKIYDSNDWGGDQPGQISKAFYEYRKALIDNKLLSQKNKFSEVILDLKLRDDIDNDISYIDLEIKRVDDEISKRSIDHNNLQLEIESLNDQIRSFQEDEDFEESDLDGKIKKFNDLYNKKDEQDGKWLWGQLNRLITQLGSIKKEMNNDAKFESDGFDKKRKEVEKIRKEVKDSGFDTIIDRDWKTLKSEKDGSLTEAIKEIIKNEKETGVTLQTISDAFDGLSKKIKLEKNEQNDWEEIKKAITDPTKYQEIPQEKEIDLSELKTISVFANADDDLLKKWKDLADSKGKYKKKSAIKDLIDRVIGDTTKKGKFVEHIKDDPNIGTGSDDEKLGNFFTKNDPKKVIETIINHEKLDTDDKKNEEKKKVKEWSEGSGSDKKVLNMTEYGSDKEDGEPSDDGVLKFLYEAEIGADHKTRNASEQDGNGDDTEEKGGFLNHVKNNWHWYTLGTLGVAVLLAVIFWKNISEWWNGPAEEEGAGAEEKGEGEIEEDK